MAQFTTGQARQAEFFASLHRAGDPLLLANAWDVASAVAIAAAGAKAIATTSAGVAWSLGVPDGAGLGAERAAAVISRMAAAVSLPVSADIEAGYGDSPDAVAATVAAVVEAGAVRISLGSAIAQAAYGVATRAAAELFTTGTYNSSAGGFEYGTMNDALTL